MQIRDISTLNMRQNMLIKNVGCCFAVLYYLATGCMKSNNFYYFHGLTIVFYTRKVEREHFLCKSFPSINH